MADVTKVDEQRAQFLKENAIKADYHEEVPADSDVIIRTVDLCKDYGEVHAVNHLNLEIHRGEVFGLLGPNGAGKTTTTLMLLGLTEPSSGKAYIDGMDCSREALAVKREVGYLPDNVGFYPDMTGRENLIFSGMMNDLSREEAAKRAVGLLERVGMTYAADRKTGTYSRGMRQRLGIADVLMKDPKIIIMDEPTLGIDPQGMHELTALIRELSVKDGRTILISSHELYQIQAISDRVGIFVHGQMIASGRIRDLGKQLQSEGLYLVDIQAEREPEITEAVGTSTEEKHSQEDASGRSEAEDGSQELIPLIRTIPGIRAIGRREDGSIHIESVRDIQKELLKLLLEHHYILREMHQRGGDLDEIYRKYFEKAGESDGSEHTKDGTEHKAGNKDPENLFRKGLAWLLKDD